MKHPKQNETRLNATVRFGFSMCCLLNISSLAYCQCQTRQDCQKGESEERNELNNNKALRAFITPLG